MAKHFDNWIDAYVNYTSEHESTLRVRKWSAISVVAAALERRVFIQRGPYYTLFPNLYTFIIGQSGIVKKTTSTGIAVDLLRQVEGVKVMAEKLTAAALVTTCSQAGKVYEHNGQKVRQSAVFAYASELAVFLMEVFGSITELLTTLYDCVPYDSSKPWTYKTIGSGDRNIYGPCLNILGASTPAWLRKCIPQSEIHGGFTSRIIFVVENSLPDKLIAWPESSEESELMKLKLIEDLRGIYGLIGEFKPTAEAKRYFADWYEYHSRTVIRQNTDATLTGYYARKGDTILKLAMSHNAATTRSLTLTTEDIQWAKKELETLEPDWKEAFTIIGKQSILAADILQYVNEVGGSVTKEQLKRRFTRVDNAEYMRALSELSSSGLAKVVKKALDPEGLDFEEQLQLPDYLDRPQFGPQTSQ